MKKTVLILISIMTLISSAVFAKEGLALTAENTLGFQLPSDLGIDNVGVLSDVIKVSAEINNKYTAEFSMPFNLITHSYIGNSEKESIFFFGTPQISIGLILNREKQINHTFNLTYSIPVDVSEKVTEYVRKDGFHRIAVSYRMGFVSDPVAFYTGLKIESSIPYRENNILNYDLPTIVLPLDFIFSINRVFSVKAGVQGKVDMPVLKNGEPEDSRILYVLSGDCELIVSVGKNYVRLGISKDISTAFSTPMIYASLLVLK